MKAKTASPQTDSKAAPLAQIKGEHYRLNILQAEGGAIYTKVYDSRTLDCLGRVEDCDSRQPDAIEKLMLWAENRAKAPTAERNPPAREEGTKWDEETFFNEISSKRSPAEVDAARKLLEWSRKTDRIWWGEGKMDGSFFPVIESGIPNHGRLIFSVWTTGKVAMQFKHLQSAPGFTPRAKRAEMAKRLNGIEGVSIPEDELEKLPSFPLVLLAKSGAMKRFLHLMDDVIAQMKAANSGRG
jgi:hypothetical protein